MSTRPNVVFIISDHTNAQALAPGSQCLTPNLDALAADGVDLDSTTRPLPCANDLHGCGYRKADGTKGTAQQSLQVYGRAGEPCPRCGQPIVRIVVAQRGTHLCTACQTR